MRKLLLISLALSLAACTGKKAPPVAPVAPVPTSSGPLIGMTAGQLGQRFGAPALNVREGDSLKIQFRSDACVLDAYLYPDRSRVLRVLHVDTRTRIGGAISEGACTPTLGR